MLIKHWLTTLQSKALLTLRPPLLQVRFVAEQAFVLLWLLMLELPAAMESYSPAFETALTAENQRRRENGLEPIEPGAGFEEFKTAFNRRWSEMTGLSAAAPGFSAKYVYPQLRREASVQQQNYTRTWNVGEASRVTEQDLGRLVNGEITLETFFNNQRGLTRSDGRTLRTGEDAWAELSKAEA